MTTISSCSSHSARTRSQASGVLSWLFLVFAGTLAIHIPLAGAAAGKSLEPAELSLPGVGDPRALLSPESPELKGFHVDEPLVFSFHGALIPVSDCKQDLRRIEKWRVGLPLRADDFTSWKGWEPWDAKEMKAVKSCDRSPCKVKLDSKEVNQLKGVSSGARFAAYLGLVQKRVEAYTKNETREPYEFPGKLVDPWAWFAQHGLTLPSRGRVPHLFTRRLVFAPGKFQPIRQVLDQQTQRDGDRVTHLLRDAYTDHYFDSWGEWVEAECIGPKSLRLLQGLFLEFDQFKKKDILASLARPKVKKAIEDRSQILFRDARKGWGISSKP